MTDGLAAFWVYGRLPFTFLVAVLWVFRGCVEVVRGLFNQVFAQSPQPVSRWRMLGAGAVLAGLGLGIAPSVAISQVQKRNDCSTGCSIFSVHRPEVAWLSFQYVVAALVLTAAMVLLSSRRGWRWMG